MQLDKLVIDPTLQDVYVRDINECEQVLFHSSQLEGDHHRYVSMQVGSMYSDYALAQYAVNSGSDLRSTISNIVGKPDVTVMSHLLGAEYEKFAENPVLPREENIILPWQTIGFVAGITAVPLYIEYFRNLSPEIEKVVHHGDMFMTEYIVGLLLETHKNK